MKICLVSPYDFMHPGGVTEHVRHLSDKLRARGHDVTVLAPSSRVGDDHGIPGYVRIGRSRARPDQRLGGAHRAVVPPGPPRARVARRERV